MGKRLPEKGSGDGTATGGSVRAGNEDVGFLAGNQAGGGGDHFPVGAPVVLRLGGAEARESFGAGGDGLVYGEQAMSAATNAFAAAIMRE